jgi:Fe-S oxidoreductase
MISQGLLPEAKTNATRLTDRHYDAAASGEAIVFVEPSCLSAVREDNPDLLKGLARERALVVAKQSVLFEEYLERECAAGRAVLNLKPGPANVMLHVHCHQRSMGLGSAAAALLSRIPSAKVTDLDAGCCGMAGSFGYSREHYDVSRAIGERKLLPAARRLTSGDTLVAAGTSCRHQVEHFAGVKAQHPAVLLRSLIKPFDVAQGKETR